MKYRAPKFIKKENFRNALEKSMNEQFKGKIIVVHAYNFKYDVNGNKINHLKLHEFLYYELVLLSYITFSVSWYNSTCSIPTMSMPILAYRSLTSSAFINTRHQ